MDIKEHKLVGVSYRDTTNKSGTINPIYIILHYDGASNSTSAVGWMLNPKSRVSAHLHISRDGVITQLAMFNIKCWHAGASSWAGLQNLNNYSIGIELQNKGTEIYTNKQIGVALDVCKAIIEHYAIVDILGHSDVAPGRKDDPGKQFPWAKFKLLIKNKHDGTT